MASDDSSSLSEASSPLSCLSTSPSPPPELVLPGASYPSPPASQESSQSGSPCPDGPDSTMSTSSDQDGPPPAKRRRISERKPRTTEYLDLRSRTIHEEQVPQLERLVNTLRKKRKIVVVAGAGISVSAGIPDFRSSTGLFSSLREEYNLKGSGKHLFDASVYKDDSSTTSFHHMVRKMSKLTKGAKPTDFHQMLATLAKDDRLMRLYTQNVDGIDTGLEPLATTVPLKKKSDGKWPKTVQLHGGLDKMVCSKCANLSEFDADLFDGPVPPVCDVCEQLDHVRTSVAGKRSHGIGRLRPRMVLYNEHNPDDEAIGAVTRDDLKKRPDAIIVVGTSMKIPGVKRIVREMCATVRDRRDGVAIWINNDPEPVAKEFENCWDIVVRGTCDEVANYVALRRHWETEEPVEPTEEEWERSARTSVEVVINKSYKPVSADRDYQKPSPSPTFSPITPRHYSVLSEDSVKAEDESTITLPPTPSKSPKRQPALVKNALLGSMKTKQPTLSASTKPKKATVKPAKGHVPKMPKKQPAAAKAKSAAVKKVATAKAQPQISQAFKQKKSTLAATGGKADKAVKSPAKKPSLQALPDHDARVNASAATSPVDPRSDKRMSIDSLCN